MPTSPEDIRAEFTGGARGIDENFIEARIANWNALVTLRTSAAVADSDIGQEVVRLGAIADVWPRFDASSGRTDSPNARMFLGQAKDLLDLLDKETFDPKEAGGIHAEVVSTPMNPSDPAWRGGWSEGLWNHTNFDIKSSTRPRPLWP